MKTNKFLQELANQINFKEIDINNIHLDSRDVSQGDLFFALKGKEMDGNDFISKAFEKGAALVISDSNTDGRRDILYFEELRKYLGIFASRFYGNPSFGLKTICVTGTNGKTTCVETFSALSNLLDERCAFISTINSSNDGEDLVKSQLTTPDAITIQRIMNSALRNNAKYMAMEASSHGLDQNRLNGTDIDFAILTSFSHDHLDYHGSLESYKSTKEKLFLDLNPKKNIICIDSSFGLDLYNKAIKKNPNTYSVSIEKPADFQASFEYLSSGLKVNLKALDEKFSFELETISRYLASNIICAIAVLVIQGVDLDLISSLSKKIELPLGRLQKIKKDNITVYIDYAHTPEALENTLLELRRFHSDPVWCLFGCGGDRDKEKRPLMGRAAEKFSEKVILTSDNPRTEDKDQIINDILDGISKKDQIIIESDRERAIEMAIEALKNEKKDGVLLIAGKGHETYQEINGSFHEFNDAEIVKFS